MKYGDWKAIDSLAFDGLTCAFDQCAMGESTEKYNARYSFGRAEQDAFAADSHPRRRRQRRSPAPWPRRSWP